MQKLSDTLRERGYVYQHSSETLEEITDGPKRTLYWGVDPTADSIHVGQLQMLLVLRRFLDDGHRVILLIGGGTGMVGDPSGRSSERILLDDETVAKNARALSEQTATLLGTTDFTMVNNAEWLHKAKLLEFLRDVGKHFTVNEMIKRDSVRPRIETPDASISYTEFSYMLLQSYDYLELNKREQCDLQIGASDQWGNILSGVELIRKTTGAQAYAFSAPLLINKATGKKFGKSEGGAIWLDPMKTSPFKFYQFWLNTDDDAVEEYLLKMTIKLSKDDIDAIMATHRLDPSKRTAQIMLAREVTDLVHGEFPMVTASQASEILFGKSVDLASLPSTTVDILKQEAPSYLISKEEGIIDVLVNSNLATSKREARQFLQDGAITLNGETIQDESKTISSSDLPHTIALLKRGKRNVVVLKLD
jgi:tyrosyl-tRNA synthetase